jgi:putative oxidoreductase
MHLPDAAKIGGPGGSAFEYPFLLSINALALAIAGGGRQSLDAVLFGRKTGAG